MAIPSRDHLDVSPRLRIPLSEFRFSFARSPGPGGQNVNKVNTKVYLWWAWEDSPSLSADVKARFRSLAAGRLTKAGELSISSSRFRDQRSNREDCLDKLCELVRAAEHPPKRRRPTKKTHASIRRRLTDKRQRKEVKQGRRGMRSDE